MTKRLLGLMLGLSLGISNLAAAQAEEPSCLCQTYVCAETTRAPETRTRLFCRFVREDRKGVFSMWEERHPAAGAAEFDCESTRTFGNLCEKYARMVPYCKGRYVKAKAKHVGPVPTCLAADRLDARR